MLRPEASLDRVAVSDDLTKEDREVLDRALSPNASKADREKAEKLCEKCKGCYNAGDCDIECVRENCGKKANAGSSDKKGNAKNRPQGGPPDE
jgi:hypothetical protein